MPHASVCDVLDLSDDGVANQSSVGAACSFDYDGNTFGGVCYLSHGDAQLCVPSCQPAALDENGNFVEGTGYSLREFWRFSARRFTFVGDCLRRVSRELRTSRVRQWIDEPYGGESCDDGNTVTEQCDHNQSCLVCNNECFEVEGQGPACGDGTVDIGFEACDDGNTETESCDYGALSCQVCNSNCALEEGQTSFCGDGIVRADHGEECDDGNTSDDDLCTSTCQDQEAFISVWRTDAASETITLPLRSGFNYNATVDWGDGTTSTFFDDPDRVHTYASAGDHTVKITGTFETFISTIVVTKTSSSPFRIWAR